MLAIIKMYSINIISKGKNIDVKVVENGTAKIVFYCSVAKGIGISSDFHTVVRELCYSLIDYYNIKNKHIRGFFTTTSLTLTIINERISLGYRDSLDCHDSGVYFESIDSTI